MPMTLGPPYIPTKLCTQCLMFMESAGSCELCCCIVGMSFSSLPFDTLPINVYKPYT